MVTTDHPLEVDHRELNGQVIDDVTWPQDVKVVTPLFSRRQLNFSIFTTVQHTSLI